MAESKHRTEQKKPSVGMVYSAIAKHYDEELPSPKEVKSNRKYVAWGEDNKYPFFLYDLYENVPTLASIIHGCQDYVVGDGVIFAGDRIANGRGETIEDIVRELTKEYALYGGFALEIIRTDDLQEVVEINSIPLRFLRTDADCNTFFYNEGYGEKWNKKNDVIIPRFLPDKPLAHSILYVKGAGITTYPVSKYQSAIIPCVIEREVNRFHLNSIKRGFMGSYLVSFNTGQPADQQKAEIEKDFYEKFCGTENAGSVLLVWTDGKDFAPEISKLDVEDFGAKYESLIKRASQQIYASYRANPNLFGIATEKNGFNQEEYSSTFKLWNKTTIQPMQRRIVSAFDQIFGEGSLQIQPFTINFDKEEA